MEKLSNYLLSIIIPHYNNPNKLQKLIESIKDFKHTQIIVVDDMSNKFIKNYLILRNYFRDRVEFYYNDTKIKGAGKCRNIGIEKSLGKWLMFSDDDDFFVENAFEVISNFLKDDSDVILFKPTSLDLITKKPSLRHVYYSNLITNYDINNHKSILDLKYRFVIPDSKMIKREFVIQNGIFFDEVLKANDVMFSVKLGHLMKNFRLVDQNVHTITKDVNTLTTIKRVDFLNSQMRVFINRDLYLKANLEKKDYYYIRSNPIWQLLSILRSGYGLKQALIIARLFKSSKIISIRDFNPLEIIQKAMISVYQKKERFF